MDLEVNRKNKKQFVIQALLPFGLLCLPQWKVASGFDYLFVTLPAGGPVCQPCWEAGTLSLCECSAWKCLALSLHHSETFLIAFLLFGNPRCHSTKWETTGELGDHESFLGQPLPQRRENQRKGEEIETFEGLPKFFKIILFSDCPKITYVCVLARTHFLSGSLGPSFEYFWRVNECKSWSNSHTCWHRGVMTGNNSWWQLGESTTISLLYGAKERESWNAVWPWSAFFLLVRDPYL